MLLKFLAQAGYALRFKFFPLEAYRYSFLLFLIIIATMSMVNAAFLAPILGEATVESTIGIVIIFSFCCTLVKLFSLITGMQFFLEFRGASKLKLAGFILLTESLIIPTILILYVPELGIIYLSWLIWIMAVQIRGLMYFSGKSIWTVMGGYVLYFVIATLIMLPLMAIFIAMGWLDADSINTHFQNILEQMKAISN